MASMKFDDYLAMIQETPVPSELVEFRTANNELYGVCLTDPLDDGLSLVYSFFNPKFIKDSPGKFIILWHLKEAKRRGLPHVYLGYWIEESRNLFVGKIEAEKMNRRCLAVVGGAIHSV